MLIKVSSLREYFLVSVFKIMHKQNFMFNEFVKEQIS